MAHILDFEIDGLAGRTESYSCKLDRTVNVFFGLNGSGKTSLLKILHSAMNNDTSLLRTVPFKSASVVIFSRDRNKTYSYSYEKAEDEESPEGDNVFDAIRPFLAPQKPSKKKTRWKVKPELNPPIRRWHHSYLPIARLYVSDKFSRVLPTSLQNNEGSVEDLFEQSFATLINNVWGAYSAEVLGLVQKAQARGLADILKAILTGKPTSKLEVELSESTAVFERVSRFMERQGSKGILGDASAFRQNYQANPQLRSVVADINSVEMQIQAAAEPRQKLESLIKQMFTGNKKLLFTDSAIELRGANDERIGIARLSSGEKQVIRIFLETLLVGVSSLILDEPEISMHVDWQRNLLSTMRQLNPQAQIIAATHSPEIIADLPDRNIFRL